MVLFIIALISISLVKAAGKRVIGLAPIGSWFPWTWDYSG